MPDRWAPRPVSRSSGSPAVRSDPERVEDLDSSDPDDAGDSVFRLDFRAIGPVQVDSMMVLDTDSQNLINAPAGMSLVPAQFKVLTLT